MLTLISTLNLREVVVLSLKVGVCQLVGRRGRRGRGGRRCRVLLVPRAMVLGKSLIDATSACPATEGGSGGGGGHAPALHHNHGAGLVLVPLLRRSPSLSRARDEDAIKQQTHARKPSGHKVVVDLNRNSRPERLVPPSVTSFSSPLSSSSSRSFSLFLSSSSGASGTLLWASSLCISDL